MSEKLIDLQIDDQIAVLRFDRPAKMNALSEAMRKQFVDALLTVKANRDVRVVILTGSGKAFCAGLDLSDVQSAALHSARDGVIGLELIDALAELDCPIIAAVNGYAFTGGLELLLCCDVIIASEQAVFCDTHARIGIVPGWGITQRLPRLIGPMRAKELSLSGERIDARLAYEWGLVNRVVPHDQLMDAAQSLAAQMSACDCGAQRAIKALVDVSWQSSIEEGLAMERTASAQAFRSYADRHINK